MLTSGVRSADQKIAPARRVMTRPAKSRSQLSPAARAVMEIAPQALPPLQDLDAWSRFSARITDAVRPVIVEQAARVPAQVEEIDADGARVYAVTPCGTLANRRAVLLEIHGGAFITGGGDLCRASAILKADAIGARVWAVDYRMPPEHPYPAALEDCFAAYRALLRDRRPEEIIISGPSAGGNLAAALVLRARDEGLPLPAALVLLSPQLDLTESGDSFRTNMGVDSVLVRSLMDLNLLYAAGCDLSDPYLSPLFGDFAKGFPPTFLSAGTRDLFLSNAVRMHRALRAVRVPAELHVLEGAPHCGNLPGTPEEEELDREIRRFVHSHWVESRSFRPRLTSWDSAAHG